MSDNMKWVPSKRLAEALETSYAGALTIRQTGDSLLRMREDKGRKPIARHVALFMAEGGESIGLLDSDGLPNTPDKVARARNGTLMAFLREKHNATKGSLEYQALEYVRENQSRFFSRLGRAQTAEERANLIEGWKAGKVDGDHAPDKDKSGSGKPKAKADLGTLAKFRDLPAAEQEATLRAHIDVAKPEVVRNLYAYLAERLTGAPAVEPAKGRKTGRKVPPQKPDAPEATDAPSTYQELAEAIMTPAA